MLSFLKKFKNKIANIFSCVRIQNENREDGLDGKDVFTQELEVLLLNSFKKKLERTTVNWGRREPVKDESCYASEVKSKRDISIQYINIGSYQIRTPQYSNDLSDFVSLNGSYAILNNTKCDDISEMSNLLLPQNGHFGTTNLSVFKDKCIQYEPRKRPPTTNFSHFDFFSFKLQLVDRLKELKGDVVTLRHLLLQLESHPNKTVLFCDNRWRRQHFESKYVEAKNRAANFMTFYKLRRKKGKNRPNKRIK
ncbi:hypothetical protein GWI33_021658 [Rhynchophorus ferrugineus]|uniref:Uncharacterized protein n=1 Tax=Rhynchophorus ferrugineus TaxID=354439 RepID=A0A834HPE3_RHYFE|nr:hypothetical protein GWI33_021659 [Rhynchophorus ferrugineus]KAF7265054.1 hypothetical protein GWI33_021658 [Rhynchophorus ferrugineus]